MKIAFILCIVLISLMVVSIIIEGFILNYNLFISLCKSHISCQDNNNDGSSKIDPAKIKQAISKIADMAKTMISKGGAEMGKVIQKLGSKS